MRAATNKHAVSIKHCASFFEACAFVKCASEATAYTHRHTHTHTVLGLQTLPPLHYNSKPTIQVNWIALGRFFSYIVV